MQLDRRRAILSALGAAAALATGCTSDRRDAAPAPTATSAPPLPPAAPPTAPAPAPTAPASTSPGTPAQFVTRGPASANAVALTFHTNGDVRIAQRLLDTVAGRAAITCFVIGEWLDANPAWGRKLVDSGHEIANHTYTHPTFASLAPEQMAREIGRCRDALVRHTGAPGRFFRPSGTDDGLTPPAAAALAEAGKAGYPIVLGWDVEPFDFRDPGAAAVRQRVLDGITPGSIVSLHFGHAGTVDALSAILDGLAARRLRAVTASQLLGLAG